MMGVISRSQAKASSLLPPLPAFLGATDPEEESRGLEDGKASLLKKLIKQLLTPPHKKKKINFYCVKLINFDGLFTAVCSIIYLN